MKKSRLVSHGSIVALLLAAAGAACTPSETPGPASGTGGRGGAGSPSGGGGTAGTTTGAGGTIVSTGAGGSTFGGAGGTTTVQKDCFTKTTPMNPVLLDFENYTGTVTPTAYGTAFGGATPNTGTAYAGPYVYPEIETSTVPTLALLAGHPPSQWAVSSTLAATLWGMGGGFWMGCANATAYRGISFWVRGEAASGLFSFGIAMESTSMPNAVNPAGGGTCPGTKDTCLPAVKADIPLTADWVQWQILWADFAPGLSGTVPVQPNGDNITGLVWSVPLPFVLAPGADPAVGPYNPVPGNVNIHIDDVQFLQ